jgi:glycosyltransferase involved in cell wall biosynthesis
MGRSVHVVVPDSIDDPARPSGGNVYDRRMCSGLEAGGWTVQELPAPGGWPDQRPEDESCLAALLDRVPADSLVLVDGLVASAAPDLIRRYADRVLVVVLLHLPLGVESSGRRAAEASMLARVAGIVTTSAWSRSWLVDDYGLPADRIAVAPPGTDAAELAPGTPTGGGLLCVGAVTRTKGHDVLVAALSEIPDLQWRCTCVGAATADPGFVDQLRARAADAGLSDRLTFTGPLVGPDLEAAYRSADALVLPSRTETYGMVVGEALAHGLPVIASDTGGVREALGHTPEGLPGVLVPPDDPALLAGALRRWLDDPDQRARLRAAAASRRPTLRSWEDTAARITEALERASGEAS